MMQKINPEWLPAPRGYNHGLVAPAGKLVFVAGQIGWDKFGKMTEGLVNQFHRALQNVMEVVKGRRWNARKRRSHDHLHQEQAGISGSAKSSWSGLANGYGKAFPRHESCGGSGLVGRKGAGGD